MKKFILIILSLLPFFIFLFDQKDINYLENKKYSSITYNKGISVFFQSFIKSFEEKFFLREKIIPINYYVNYLMGHSKNEDLFIGKDGYVFLKNIDNITRQQRCLDGISNKDLKDNVQILFDLIKIFEKRNIQVTFVPLPNQQTIYYDKLPFWHTSKCKTNYWDEYQKLFDKNNFSKNYLDLRTDLIEKGNTYNKYEGHWNNRGMQLAYVKIIKKILNRQSNNNYKDGGKDEWSWQFLPFVKEINTYPIIENSTNRFKQNNSIFVYGDSFSTNYFISNFKNDFKDIIVINKNEKNPSINDILKYKIDHVLFPIVERNFFNPNFSNILIKNKILEYNKNLN